MNDISNKIQEVISSFKPYLQKDGGDLKFIDLTADNVLKVKFTDSCNDCKFKLQTLMIIEKQIRKIFPELLRIEEV